MRRSSIHRVTIADLRDTAGTLATSGDALCKVIVKGNDGTTLLAATNMTYDSAGRWYYDVPAANFPSTNAPWTVIIEVYNAAGSTLRATFTQTGADEWWS